MIGAIGSLGGLLFVYILGAAEDKRAMAFTLSMIAGISVTSLVLITTYYIPERGDFQGRAISNPFKSLADIVRNPHALILLVVIGIETFGAASIGLLVPYMVDYVIPEEQIPFSKAAYFPHCSPPTRSRSSCSHLFGFALERLLAKNDFGAGAYGRLHWCLSDTTR